MASFKNPTQKTFQKSTANVPATATLVTVPLLAQPTHLYKKIRTAGQLRGYDHTSGWFLLEAGGIAVWVDPSGVFGGEGEEPEGWEPENEEEQQVILHKGDGGTLWDAVDNADFSPKNVQRKQYWRDDGLGNKFGKLLDMKIPVVVVGELEEPSGNLPLVPALKPHQQQFTVLPGVFLEALLLETDHDLDLQQWSFVVEERMRLVPGKG